MIVQHNPPLHLTYCLNIHPGESWGENFAAIREKTVEVKARVSADQWFGLGLRLSAQGAAELADEATREEAMDFFREHQLYPFSVNAFPYGRFHQGPVKENVYAPDWRMPERRDYTIQTADVLAAMLPEGIEGSISTVPCSFKPWVTTEEEKIAMVDNLAACVAYLSALHDDTGRMIHLGLEPEPDCFLETTNETVSFFENFLYRRGAEEVARILGLYRSDAEQLVRKHLGVCFDTCHVALQFEDLTESLRAYKSAGILISKVQLSAALRAKSDPDSWEALRSFVEPVYLHQVKGRTGAGTRFAWYDLPPALEELSDFPEVKDLRVHFHVPLFAAPTGLIGSTADTLTPEFFHELRGGVCSHLEIETYTFDVLPPEIHPGDLVKSIAREYSWVMERLGAH